MARALAPIPVVTAALEDFATHPEGPAAALLDLLEVPADLRAGLKPARRGNSGQSGDMREAFRELNAQALGKSELKRRKDALLRPKGTAT
jgi:hypothetical protein